MQGFWGMDFGRKGVFQTPVGFGRRVSFVEDEDAEKIKISISGTFFVDEESLKVDEGRIWLKIRGDVTIGLVSTSGRKENVQ